MNRPYDAGSLPGPPSRSSTILATFDLLLLEVVPTHRVLFGSEMLGAVRGDDPGTNSGWDDTGRYLEAARITAERRQRIYAANTLEVYPRVAAHLTP